MIDKIKEIVTLKKFKPVIEIQGVGENEKKQLVSEYIITEQVTESIEDILETITKSRSPERRENLNNDLSDTTIKRSFLLRGAYGSGKSYFLLMVSSILESIQNNNVDELLQKFSGFNNITYQINLLKNKKINYFVVNINGVCETEREFEDVIRKNFIDKCKEVFQEYDSNSIYENAIKKLNEDKNSNRWDIVQEQLNKMDIDFDYLISGLKKYKRDFLEKYKILIENAYNTSVDLYAGDFKTFIIDASKFVKDNGYTGICFIFDEFSAYLTTSIDDGKINKNLSKVQQLSESTDIQTANNIIFIASIHKNLNILLKNTRIEKEDIDKVVGRFKELELQFSSDDKLIENTLNINKQKYDEMRTKYNSQVYQVEQITNNKIRNIYPIHESTLSYLKLLSQLYAQENRTIFKFLSDVVDYKIKNEDIIVDNKLNLITCDYIYDYFIEQAADYEENNGLIVSANTIFRECNEIWQKKIIKTLIVARLSVHNIKEVNIKIGLSIHDLCNALLIENEDIIKKFLDNLTEKQDINIFYDPTNDLYEFYESGSSKINVEKLVNQEAKSIDFYSNVIKYINDNNGDINLGFIQKGDKNVTPVEREISGKYFTLNKFENCRNLNNELFSRGDATINYIIPTYFEVNNININQLKANMKECFSNIAVAVPKTYKFVYEDICKYEAMKKVLNSNIIKDDEKTKSYLDKEIKKYENKIMSVTKEFSNINNLIYIFNNLEIMEFKSRDDLVAFILNRYYYKFPKINTQNISKRTTTNKLINNFIVPKERIMSSKSSSEEDRQIKETLECLDLVKIKPLAGGDKKATLKIPERKNNELSAEIFDIVISDKYDIENKFDILCNAPYGLPDYLVEMYISSAISLGKIYIVENEIMKENNSTNINNLRNGKCKLFSIGDMQLDKLIYSKRLWTVISKYISSLEFKSFIPENGPKLNEVRISLGKDVENFNKILGTNLNVLKEKGFNFNNIQIIYNNFIKLNNIPKPDDFIEMFNSIPCRLYPNSDINKALTDTEKILDDYFSLVDNIGEVIKVLKNFELISLNSYRFSENYKINQIFNELKESRDDFLKNYGNKTEINKIDELNKRCIRAYNEEYIKLHNDLYKTIDEGKNNLNNIEEIEIIQAYEQFNIKNVRDLKNIINEFNNRYKSCIEKYDLDEVDKFIECICMKDKKELTDFQKVKEEFDEEYEKNKKTIAGLMGTYYEEIYKLSNGKTGKSNIVDFIKNKDENLSYIYSNFMQNITNNPLLNKNQVIEECKKLKDIFNEYIEYVNKPIEDHKLTINIPKPTKQKVSLESVNNEIKNEINYTGKKEITPLEYIEMIKKIVNSKFIDKIISIIDNK